MNNQKPSHALGLVPSRRWRSVKVGGVKVPFEKTPIDLVHDVLVKHTKVHSSPDSLTPRPSSCPPPQSVAESPSVLSPVRGLSPVIKLKFTVVDFSFLSRLSGFILQNGMLAATVVVHALHALSVDFETEYVHAATFYLSDLAIERVIALQTVKL